MDEKQIDKCCSDDQEMEWCAPGCYCKKIKPIKKIMIVVGLLLAIGIVMGSMFIAGDKTSAKQPVPNVSRNTAN